MPPKTLPRCDHSKLVFSPSSHASTAGYKRTSSSQRIAAATPQVIVKPAAPKDDQFEGGENASTFPAPLVLPEDELAWDPKYPAQSLRSWIRGIHRNKVTPERRTIYFAGPPDIEPGLEYTHKWAQPRHKSIKGKAVQFPETKDVLGYLEAFYHGLPVKMLPSPNLCFTADVDDETAQIPTKSKRMRKGKKGSNEAKTSSQTLWLNTHTASGCVGIRSRPTPKGDFTHQLNLNDLLDAAIEILPDDAYALLMMVEHDIYEDDDDDFACGRAYGGSRIAVVSAARYNPILDVTQRVERDHSWPASHCEKYMQSCCDAIEDDEGQDGKMEGVEIHAADSNSSTEEVLTPMQAALAAHVSLPSPDRAPSATALYGLWLGRVCRTASHELGHCFGIDHCVYYACAMQGTSSIIEDARQPPYLCPVDLAKILTATGADKTDTYRALMAFCEKFRDTHLFAAHGAWIRGRLETG